MFNGTLINEINVEIKGTDTLVTANTMNTRVGLRRKCERKWNCMQKH